ncbi:MAG: DNA alkylation repair protein [Ruminococcus sp.]|nr:DNA alkylation repair protein [Ruminococcus sp.]
MKPDEIRKELEKMSDKEYLLFQKKLIPELSGKSIFGVRTPQLRAFAKRIAADEDTSVFLAELPHSCFDEDQLHAFVVSLDKDFQRCLERTELFLPYIDNWATCDQFSPKIFKKNRQALLPCIRKWLGSGHTYTVRFAIGMLMQHFLDEDFSAGYLDIVADIKSEEYYINMERAWYFATAMAKQYESAVIIVENNRLDKWTHNKTIQKCIESRRIAPEIKEYLKSLRIK